MIGAFMVFMLLGLGVWVGMIGRFGVAEALQGGLVVASAWGLFLRVMDQPPRLPPGRELAWLAGVGRYLAGYVAPEMLRSTWRVFSKVLASQLALNPAIVGVELPGASRSGVILLAYGLSLTPGTQVVAIDEVRPALYVHLLDAPDPEAARAQIRAVYDRYLREVTTW